MVLRNALYDVRQTFDPEKKDPNFDRMVVVGHSMGGIITRFLVQDSGDSLWSAFFKKPLDEYSLSPEHRELLRKAVFFEPVPFISRAIMICAPHRGSDFADKWYAQLFEKDIRMSSDIRSLEDDLLPELAKEDPSFRRARPLTSISGLSPENRTLLIMADLPIVPDVPYHCIMGNRKKAGEPGGTDGIVPYESAHLDGAESELIVKSGHGAHKHPLAILEVQRILHEHLKTAGRPPASARR
jgi:pimeloyl-ACP methyl ester carboxylesterase